MGDLDQAVQYLIFLLRRQAGSLSYTWPQDVTRTLHIDIMLLVGHLSLVFNQWFHENSVELISVQNKSSINCDRFKFAPSFSRSTK